MRFYINDKIFIDFISIIFIASEGILQNISFLRMYVMAMFWVTLIAYLFVKALIEKVCWKHWILIGVVAISSALTHYYCIIYLGITCMVFTLCMVVQRRWKEIVLLVSHMLISASVSIVIFPSMISHIFFGYRGTESLDNFANATKEEHWERLKVCYGFIDKQMLGELGGGFTVLVILLVIMFVILHKNQGVVQFHFYKQQIMKVMLVGIPVIAYFGLVSISAPYVISRYLFPIYAVTLGMFIYLVFVVLNKLFLKQNIYIAICFVITAMILNGVGSINWQFLFEGSVDLLDKAAKYSDQNCISIYDEEWKEMSSFYELRNYKSVTFIQQKNINRIVQYDELFGDSFILTVIGGNDEQIIGLIQDYCPYLTQYEKLGSYEYSTTYRIYVDEGKI